MTRLVSALACLCLATLSLFAPANAADTRLGRDVVPTFQSISLRLDADSTSYTGATHIELKATVATQTFRFHARGVTLDKIRFTSSKGPVTVWSPWMLGYGAVLSIALLVIGLLVFRRASGRFAEMA